MTLKEEKQAKVKAYRGAEDAIMAVLLARNGLGISSMELKAQSGIDGTRYRDALVRLEKKKLAVRWITYEKQSLIFAYCFAHCATYERTLTPDSLFRMYANLGQPLRVVARVSFRDNIIYGEDED
jgi:hypothetical protein